jgi:hypothetical protein
MMRVFKQRWSVALVAALAVVLVAPVSTDQAPPVNVPGIDKPVVVVTGEVTGTESWVNTNYYVLRGTVFVQEGATLNIQAGTRVLGEAGSLGTLVVMQGGRLNAVGTREQPIVFTSDQAPGTRNRGDWGGIILNGRAPLNVPGGENEGEADTGIYGGRDENDNSGTLRYVRVEFAGTLYSPDNELNGIALQGVGRGTTIDHVQVHMNRDDAIEFFGGTADIKYAVASNAADDSFDWTFGWRGRAQFIAMHQRGDDADRGIEADNNEFGNNLEPRSNPLIYNVTLCGDPFDGAESTVATTLRRGTALTLRNFLITGSKSQGLTMETSNQDTLGQVNNGTTQIGAGVVWGMPTPILPALQPFVASGRFPDVRSSTVTDPGFAGLSPDCFNHANPNFQPTSVATLAGGQLAPIQPPNDGFFEAVTFIGAVPPAPADDWTRGWTSYPAN